MLVKTSVRNLIEYVMRSGDIDTSFRDNQRMLKGIRAHQKIQASYGKNYTKEYSLKNTTSLGGVSFEVEGRADGIIKEGKAYTIDEIKSTTRPLEDIDGENKLHWAQAKCYAYFFSSDKNLENISITLTYVSTEDYTSKIFKKDFNFDDLEKFYLGLLSEYLNFSKIISTNTDRRNKSSKDLVFPYESYRKGQRKMAVGVYRSILDEKNIFIDAPTGIGKTVSSTFPAIKSLGEDLTDKIFYLTSKITTGNEALKALILMEGKGLYIKALQIISKERICLNDEVKCNPQDCPFAKGHFDRVNDALKDILSKERIMDFDTIRSYSEKYRVCPFEFELDIATYSDFIICDYNYVFDPSVYLKRFFDELIGRFVFLIDEAHNLLDRSREMYSFSFTDEQFIEIKEYFDQKKDKLIIRKLNKVIEFFDQTYIKYGSKEVYYTGEHIDEVDEKLIGLQKSMEKFLIDKKDHPKYEEILNLYFDINKYLRISDSFMEGFYNVISYDKASGTKTFEIKCVDPSKILKEKYKYSRSTVFFSATLSPMKFFMDMLGAGDSLKLRLDSPFDRENLLILQKSISTRYRDRQENIGEICDTINKFVSSKPGNYFIFFPSFTYLKEVAEIYKYYYDDKILIQDSSMSQKDRAKFLRNFTCKSSRVGFVVLGGIFSEGVDLIGDRLIGSMIISVGMPGVSFDRDLIMKHFSSKGLSGFDYSYTFPGLNKVFQAAGRVIRSEEDRGIVYLVDDRYRWDKYRHLYPSYWKNIKYLDKKDEDLSYINKFWSNNEKKRD